MRHALALGLGLIGASLANAQPTFISIGGPRGGHVWGLDTLARGGVAMFQDGQLLCSLNDGLTWSVPFSAGVSRASAASRIGHGILVVEANTQGEPVRQVSRDGCATWQTPKTQQEDYTLRSLRTPDGWFAEAMGTMGTLVHSADSGATWQSTGQNARLVVSPEGHVYAYRVGRLLRWVREPRAWDTLAVGHRADAPVTAFAAGPNGRRLLTQRVDRDTQVLRASTDGGLTWRDVRTFEAPDPSPYEQEYEPVLRFGADGSALVAATRLFTSADLVSWTDHGLHVPQLRAVRTRAGWLIVGSQNTSGPSLPLRRRLNLGSWGGITPLPVTAGVHALAEGSGGKIYGVNTFGVFELQPDRSWKLLPGTQPSVTDPYLLPSGRPTFLLVAPWGEPFVASIAPYNPWDHAAAGQTSGKASQGPAEGAEMFVSGTGALFFGGWTHDVSYDRGATWTSVDSMSTNSYVQMPSGRILAAGSNPQQRDGVGRVWASDDDGRTWQQMRTLPGAGGRLVHWRGASTVWLHRYAGGYGFPSDSLYRSDDEGRTWSAQLVPPRLTLPGRYGSRSVAFSGGPNGALLAVASDTLFQSNDGGNTFAPFTALTRPFNYAAPYLVLSNGQVVMNAPNGGVMMSTLSVDAPSDERPATEALGLRVSPLPARSQVRVTWAGAAAATVEALDLLGRRVAQLHNGPANATVWDVSALPAGVYVLRVSAGGRTESRLVPVVR